MLKTVNNFLTTLFFFSVGLAIVSAFLKFFYFKNYDYIVEARCDPAVEKGCFYRNCDVSLGECPPDNLMYYKQYMVKARDFNVCDDNSCEKQCLEGAIQCTVIFCDLSKGDICVDEYGN